MVLGLVGSGRAEARQRCDCAPVSHNGDILGTVGDWSWAAGQGLGLAENRRHLLGGEPGRNACVVDWSGALYCFGGGLEGGDVESDPDPGAEKVEAHASKGDV